MQIANGALAGDIYEYIGTTLTDSDPETGGNQQFDLSVQQYRHASLWKQANVGAEASQVRAYIDDSSLRAADALTIDADAAESIDSFVVAAAIGIGGGSGAGVAVSGAGSYV